ncbi:MAG: molybdenum cofactor guanylyltransferase [Actinomycetota bacterium]|jgi:molybdenum cofactor guanylyltransferase
MDRQERTSGIVLAGGRSSRFGSEKMAAEYRGRPLLLHAVEVVDSLSDETLLVISPEAEEPEGVPLGVRFVRDSAAFRGPLAGLSAGLARATGDVAIVAGGDMPRLARLVLVQMRRMLESSDTDAVALLEGADVRPLPLLLRTRVSPIVEDLLREGERSLRALLASFGVVEFEETEWRKLDPDGGTLLDVDSPEDLRK